MITIDISPAVHGRAGIGRMAGQLYHHLRHREDIIPFYNRAAEIGLADRAKWHQPSSAVTLDWGDRRWRLAVMAATLGRRSQANHFPHTSLFHGTDHLLPYLPHKKTVFTLHDLTPFSHGQSHTTLNRLFSRLMWPSFFRQASWITCDSQSTQRDLLRRFPSINPAKTSVVYLGVDRRFRPLSDNHELEGIRQKYNLPDRFFLFVGTIEPRKNVPGLIKAFHHARLKGIQLVIAGKKGWQADAVDQAVEDYQMGDRIQFTGFIADNDLPGLYNLAEAFIFPTFFEGFGFPVLEALACGTPVICSNISSLPEITGEAAYLIDPIYQEQLTTAMAEVANSTELRQKLRDRGLQQAKKFSWETTAQEMLLIYQKVLAIKD